MASAKRSLRTVMTLRRVFSDRSILVLYIEHFLACCFWWATILHVLVVNPKKERNVRRGVDGSILDESHLQPPSAGQLAHDSDGELGAGAEKAQLGPGHPPRLTVELRAYRPHGPQVAG